MVTMEISRENPSLVNRVVSIENIHTIIFITANELILAISTMVHDGQTQCAADYLAK